MALVGGVNLLLSPELSVVFSQARMLSPDGRCHSFSEQANGYVRGEGCGVLVVKPLSKAKQDGDTIWAMIRGSAVNQDGRSNGLTAPNGLAQQAVIRQALDNAKVKPSDVHYVEAHGSGTPLGDPIEIAALSAVYGEVDRTQPLKVGCVKTQIGHLEAAAGIAGLIKTVAALKYRTLPANLHFAQPSTRIPWDENRIEVIDKMALWPRQPGQRELAGVSAFGFGGTNAHVILERYRKAKAGKAINEIHSDRSGELLLLSARCPQSLQRLATRHLEHLTHVKTSAELSAYTHATNTRRAQLRCRAGLFVTTVDALRQQLMALSEIPSTSVLQSRIDTVERAAKTAFVFTGQGSQYIGMGKTLYETQPQFRAVIDECEGLLREWLDVSLIDLLP